MDGKERFFSVESKSKTKIKKPTVTNSVHENVLIEGIIDRVWNATVVDEVVLEALGEKGVLSVDCIQDEIKTKPNQTQEA